MFGKAKRFEPVAKSDTQVIKKIGNGAQNPKKPSITTPKINKSASVTSDQKSETSSFHSIKSTFATPKPTTKCTVNRALSSSKKMPMTTATLKSAKKPTMKPEIFRNGIDQNKIPDLLTAQEIEIRNKDYTIAEYGQQIEDLKNEIAILQNQIKEKAQIQNQECLDEIEHLNREIEKVNLEDENQMKAVLTSVDYEHIIIGLQGELQNTHSNIAKLEEEILEMQMELSTMESVISIRDSLCKDLQEKLTEKESALEELRQRLEMVKGHHALALEANESIRREYKVELECLKTKMDEEKQTILVKSKNDQDAIKNKYTELIENLKHKMETEKIEAVAEVERMLKQKEAEMKAKLEQIEERAHEKLRLCEIQYEQRANSVQEHWQKQDDQIKLLELELGQLKYSLTMGNEQKMNMQSELIQCRTEREALRQDKTELLEKIYDLEELSKKNSIEYENERNKLVAEVERVVKEKHRYETSLNVTRDIVQVLSDRLKDSDNELDNLDIKVQEILESKQVLEAELTSYKSMLNNSVIECSEYKDALVNILKSKAALTKEHNRMIEHNATLIDCLETVEKEAYREFGNIKDEWIDDVEMFKKESTSQIQKLQDEVEKKSTLALLATEHADKAQAAAEQSRQLLQHAAHELERLEAENHNLQQQIHDQQSLAVEVSLLRQENEELTMTVAKQCSFIDKLKKDSEQIKPTTKSPSVQRKVYKVGKENNQILVSPLRERNH